jgi:hypothetical protein
MNAVSVSTAPTKEIAITGKVITALDVYGTATGVDPLLAAIKAEVAKFVPDVTTKKGREAIGSLAHKISLSKTALDELGKELNAELKARTAKVDAERKTLRDRLDEMRDEVLRPRDEWEAAEATRIQHHEEAIRDAQATQSMARTYTTMDQIDDAFAEMEQLKIRPWEEFADRGKEAVTNAIIAIAARRDQIIAEEEERKKVEAEREELARLRQLQAERDEHDRKAREAIAEEEARRQTEAERERIAAQAVEDARARLMAEQEAQRKRHEDELEANRRRLLEQEEEHARELAAAEQRGKAELARLQREKEAAIEAERERVATEKAAELEAAQKREANKRHAAKINNEASADIAKAIAAKHADGVAAAGDVAKAIVVAIARGQIRHVTIAY